jgi:hypothetical protein
VTSKAILSGLPCATALLALLASSALAQPQPPTEDLLAGPPGGPWRRLFLDAVVVEQQSGLERVFHAATKHVASPVIRADRPWEMGTGFGGPYLYGTVLWDEGRLRMWYHTQYGGAYLNCLAESTDGIVWSKPNLGLVEVGGSKENNLVIGAGTDPAEKPPFKGEGECHNPSVIKRPWESDPAKRYVLFCYGQEYRWARLAFSPDGRRWTFPPETREKGLFASSDVLSFFWDPYALRYVGTWKANDRRGRAVGVVWSRDGLAWEKPVETPVFVADDLDPEATQVYGMPVFPYQGLYLGLPWIYNARWFKYGGYSDERLAESELGSPCTIDAQFAWSWDLINWTRPPPRLPFIPRGAPGQFDSGMIFTARAPVQVGDELYFYYGGFDGTHNAERATACVGLATLRLDGFCSLRAGPDEGWLISRREPFRVPRVTINARTAADGYVLAELLDRQDRIIPGFGRAECVPFRGDAVRHRLTWRTETLPEACLEGDKKIRFVLRNADLYSYLPDPTSGPVTVIYDPATNGGLLPSDPALRPSQAFSREGKPTGHRVVTAAGLTYLDLHSAAAEKTNACFSKSESWTDDQDWCLEAWLRVADAGDEPIYGLSVLMRPDYGRAAGIYLSADAVGIITHRQHEYRVLGKTHRDTTQAFHWYRLAHTGGASGEVVLSVDGSTVARVPYADLEMRMETGWNVVFGPNAAHREGRLHVAKLGYRIGSTETLCGPVGAGQQ